MGWDISIKEQKDDGTFEELDQYCLNYTHNTNFMWREAGIKIDEWEGLRCRAVLDELNHGIKDLKENHTIYGMKNPDNGWGSCLGLIKVLCNVRDVFEYHPDALISVSM